MIMSSVTRIKFIKNMVIFRYHIKVSSHSDHEIKSCSCSNSSTKVGKNEEVGNIFWITKRGNEGITNRGSFRDFKSGQELQIGQRDFKLGQRLQIGARGISNWGRDYKSVQNKRSLLITVFSVMLKYNLAY